MRFIKLSSGKHQYHHLPEYSSFLLANQLEALVKEQLKFSREINLPLLKLLQHFNEEQILAIGKASMTEYLRYLSENRGTELIELSLKKWLTDQLEVIGKFELVAEDITLLNFVREKSFRKFVPSYTQDLTTAIEIIDELQSFFSSAVTAAMNNYILVIKDQLNKHEKELLEAQRIAHVGNFELDLTTYKAVSSPEIFRMFEIEEGTGIESFMKFIHPDDVEKVQEAMAISFIAGNYECEYRFVRNGRVKHFHSIGVVIYEEDVPKKLIATVQDITNRKKIEQELLEKTVALERSNESLEQFAYVASHDLREPLRKISLLTDKVLKQEVNFSDSSRLLLHKIQSSSVGLQQMIEDIMSYSTITQFKEKEIADLGNIVQQAIDLLDQTVEEKKAIITFDGLPKVNVIVPQFRQLFQNLIANSLKFSNPGVPPVISISYKWLLPNQIKNKQLSAASKFLQLSVQDNGIGFNQEFSKQIFNLFSRLHHKSAYEGSGFGLAIAKRIVEHHHGLIEASSKEDEGATISFIIPQ